MTQLLGLEDDFLSFLYVHFLLLGQRHFVDFRIVEAIPIVAPLLILRRMVNLVDKNVRIDTNGGSGQHDKPHVIIMLHDHLLDIQVVVNGVGLDVPTDLLERIGAHPGHLRSDRVHGGSGGCNLHGIDRRSRFGRSEDGAGACEHGGPDRPPCYFHKLTSSYFSFIHHKPPYCEMISCGSRLLRPRNLLDVLEWSSQVDRNHVWYLFH